MPKSTLSLAKSFCFFMILAGHLKQCTTVFGSSLLLLQVGGDFLPILLA